MPEIPRYNRQQIGPTETGEVPVSIEQATRVANTDVAASKALQGTINDVAGTYGHFERVKEAEQKAERALKAVELKHVVEAAVDNAASDFEQDGNWKGYDNKLKQHTDSIKATHIDSIEDPILKRAATVMWMGEENRLSKAVRHKKIQLMTDESKAVYGVDYDKALKDYVYTEDPAQKEQIKANIELIGHELENSNLLPQGHTIKEMAKFDRKAAILNSEMLIDKQPEVAYAALNERDANGQYTKFTNLAPEDRIQQINRAESGIRIKAAETERKERQIQEDTISDLYNKLDNKGYSRQKLLQEVQAAEVKDPITGIRRLSPQVAHSLRRSILHGDGEGGEGNSAEFIRMGEKILAGKVTAEDIIANKGLKGSEKKVLWGLMQQENRRDNKEETAEQKAINQVFKNERSFILKEANKTIDALYPDTKGSGKELNTSLKATILSASGRYDANTIGELRSYVKDTLSYAKDQPFFVSKSQIAKKLVESVNPSLATGKPAQATTQPAAGVLSEQDARAQLKAKGIEGKAANDWILKYRESGKVR